MKECDRCGHEFEEPDAAEEPLVERVLEHFENQHGLVSQQSAAGD